MNLNRFPFSSDYLEALKNPSICFTDNNLKQAKAEKSSITRRPITFQGTFSIVVKLKSTVDNSFWALRCFTRQPDSNIKERYVTLSNYLKNVDIPYFAKFEFIEQGIKVKDNWYPAIKMDWVEGVNLDEFIRKNNNDSINLRHLYTKISNMRNDLKNYKIAHGDIQHGNIIVIGKPYAPEIRLVDYDSVYVDGSNIQPPNQQLGNYNYYHPNQNKSDYGLSMDDFAYNVILLSIRSVYIEKNLWRKFHSDNCLIFQKKDYENISSSEVFKNIRRLKDHDSEIENLYTTLFNSLQKPLNFKRRSLRDVESEVVIESKIVLENPIQINEPEYADDFDFIINDKRNVKHETTAHLVLKYILPLGLCVITGVSFLNLTFPKLFETVFPQTQKDKK